MSEDEMPKLKYRIYESCYHVEGDGVDRKEKHYLEFQDSLGDIKNGDIGFLRFAVEPITVAETGTITIRILIEKRREYKNCFTPDSKLPAGISKTLGSQMGSESGSVASVLSLERSRAGLCSSCSELPCSGNTEYIDISRVVTSLNLSSSSSS
ncbi:hypothetical protein F2Q68_00023177 [Brassica cretica]|uniref:Uncharacterized protein n=2 Tax=Brassica cretica TaxID=69181 RepID=A0A8S9FUD1_BRACR|nr:hypothetical protein F2Q68_00023177 [Brassica cretica]KAF3500091.1 hypothetical protein F2Q69_00045399 [Brassica cretica]KAF3564266.1 hypothetical protein DY000_02019622 [Brassica cretica]